MAIPIPVLENAILLVPKELPHEAFNSVVLSHETSVVILVAENGGDFGQTFGIQGIQRVEADIIEFHCVGLRIVGDVVVHWAVVHPALPFGLHEEATPADGKGRAPVTAPLKQTVLVAISPGLSIAAVRQPPFVPLLQSGVRPSQLLNVGVSRIVFPYDEGADRRLRSIRADTVSGIDIGDNSIWRLSQENCPHTSPCLLRILNIGQKRAKKTVPLTNNPSAKAMSPIATDTRKLQAK